MDLLHKFTKKEKGTLEVFLLFIPIVIFFTVLAFFMLAV